jgi:hypothetical protein
MSWWIDTLSVAKKLYYLLLYISGRKVDCSALAVHLGWNHRCNLSKLYSTTTRTLLALDLWS